MPEQHIESELETAENARAQLTKDVRDLARTARGKYRVACYVGLGLIAVTVLTVFAAGTKALLRRSPRQPQDTPPLWNALGRRMLLGAAGPLAAHLTRRWLVAQTGPAPRDSSVEASEPSTDADT